MDAARPASNPLTHHLRSGFVLSPVFFQATEILDGCLPLRGVALLTSRRASPAILNRAPDTLRRDWHVEMTHAERGERVVDGVEQRRQRADGAGLAHALGAERVDLGRHLVRV